jgi:HSP20 family protein
METPTQPNGVAREAARHFIRPRAHITENPQGYVVDVEMPGVPKSGLDITFENGELTLTGRRAPFQTQAELVYRESNQADYRRVFELDASIDAAHIQARLDQGVLTLTLPKAEAAKPRRIEINGLN